MNIFYVDQDPVIAAKSLHNKHISKMALEACQLMVNCFDDLILETSPLTAKGTHWKKSHINHPMSKWVFEGHGNFVWLYNHARALTREYQRRYNKTSSLVACLNWIQWIMNNEIDHGRNLDWFCNDLHTPIPQCMPDRYKVPHDPVEAYRRYYVGEKYHYFITNKSTGITKEYYNKWMRYNEIPLWFREKFGESFCWNFVNTKCKFVAL